MYTLRVRSHFDASHFLKDYQGKCSRMHGHRWTVEVAVEGEHVVSGNMLVDFVFVKMVVGQHVEELDHYTINERLGTDNPTAEFIAKWFFDVVTRLFHARGPTGVRVASVTIWESPDCSVEYRP